MYISKSTYGGLDWHDSYTVYRQLTDKNSYCIEEQRFLILLPETLPAPIPMWKI